MNESHVIGSINVRIQYYSCINLILIKVQDCDSSESVLSSNRTTFHEPDSFTYLNRHKHHKTTPKPVKLPPICAQQNDCTPQQLSSDRKDKNETSQLKLKLNQNNQSLEDQVLELRHQLDSANKVIHEKSDRIVELKRHQKLTRKIRKLLLKIDHHVAALQSTPLTPPTYQITISTTKATPVTISNHVCHCCHKVTMVNSTVIWQFNLKLTEILTWLTEYCETHSYHHNKMNWWNVGCVYLVINIGFGCHSTAEWVEL